MLYERFLSKTDAEHGDGFMILPDNFHEITGISRYGRTRGDHQQVRMVFCNNPGLNGIPENGCLATALLKIIHEIEREGIKIVDDENVGSFYHLE